MIFLLNLRKGCKLMGNYRLSEDAVGDLIRIHQWGVRRYREAQADKYYNDFLTVLSK